jgi:hypothetical protein
MHITIRTFWKSFILEIALFRTYRFRRLFSYFQIESKFFNIILWSCGSYAWSYTFKEECALKDLRRIIGSEKEINREMKKYN